MLENSAVVVALIQRHPAYERVRVYPAGVLQLVEIHVQRQLIHAGDLEILLGVIEPGLSVVHALEGDGVVPVADVVFGHYFRDEFVRGIGKILPVSQDGEDDG